MSNLNSGFHARSLRRRQLATLAARHAIPAIYFERQNAVAGGLMSYRPDDRFKIGWRIQLDAFNPPNSKSDLITYAYGSLVKTDALFAMCFPASGPPTAPSAVCQNGVMDRVLHPVEPLAARLTLAGRF